LKTLSKPITSDDISNFIQCLVAISFDSETECWLYVGSRQTAKGELRFKPGVYANMRFHGTVVRPHQFALAAAEGIALADLAGYQIHHYAKLGHCIGYRCCNPEHLFKLKQREHARKHAAERAGKAEIERVAMRQLEQIKGSLMISPVERGSPELRPVTGAGRRRRFLAGVPFLIRLGQMDRVEGNGAAEGSEEKRQ
jgi:hypothetical protein